MKNPDRTHRTTGAFKNHVQQRDFTGSAAQKTGTARAGNAPSEAKRLATLKARAALAGVTLIADSTPRYLVTRWGLTRELDSLDSVEGWLDLVTGSRA